jgi:exonuclease VII small subunit
MTEDTYTFEQARARLDEIAKQAKGASLEKCLDLLEEGVRLANVCTEKIDHTKWRDEVEEVAGEVEARAGSSDADGGQDDAAVAAAQDEDTGADDARDGATGEASDEAGESEAAAEDDAHG